DRRQDQPVLVEQRRAREIAGGARRIEGEVVEEAAARRVRARECLELCEIAEPRLGTIVALDENRLVERTHATDLTRPRCVGARELDEQLAQRGPRGTRRGRRLERGERGERRRGSTANRIDGAARERRADPR